jgi:hypothetical protein
MYPSADSHQLSILLRISTGLDVVGDVSAKVDNPADLLAWTTVLPESDAWAWRTRSGNRYVHVTAAHNRLPVHGRVTAVLSGDQHRYFWDELLHADDLEPGDERRLGVKDLARAWEAMPLDQTT